MTVSSDFIADDCTGTVVEKQAEESGAIYAICELVAMDQSIRSLTYYIPGDAPILCEGSGGDVSAQLAACRSLRKKG